MFVKPSACHTLEVTSIKAATINKTESIQRMQNSGKADDTIPTF